MNYLAVHKLACLARRGNPAARAAARDKLIIYFCRAAVPDLAWRWRKRLGYDDARAIGNLATVEAVNAALRTYDPKQPKGLTSYIRLAVQRALSTATDDTRSVVRLPEGVHKELRDQRKGRALPACVEARIAPLVNLGDSSLSIVGTDGEFVDLADHLVDNNADTEAVASRNDIQHSMRSLISRVIPNIRNQQIVLSLYGFTDEGDVFTTAAEVAKQFGVSLQTVEKVRRNALKQLRTIPELRDLLRTRGMRYVQVQPAY